MNNALPIEMELEAANVAADNHVLELLEEFEDEALEALYDATCVTLKLKYGYYDAE